MLINLGYEEFVSWRRCVGLFTPEGLPEYQRRKVMAEVASQRLPDRVRSLVLTDSGAWVASTLSVEVLVRRSEMFASTTATTLTHGNSGRSPRRTPIDGQENKV